MFRRNVQEVIWCKFFMLLHLNLILFITAHENTSAVPKFMFPKANLSMLAGCYVNRTAG